jgi:hypothetical protein
MSQESPLPALRADLEKEEKEEEKLAAEALVSWRADDRSRLIFQPPQSARPPHSAGSGETANEHTTQHNGEVSVASSFDARTVGSCLQTPTIDGTAHAAANADGGDLPIHAIVSDMVSCRYLNSDTSEANWQRLRFNGHCLLCLHEHQRMADGTWTLR